MELVRSSIFFFYFVEDHTVCLSLNQPLFISKFFFFLLCLWLVTPVDARPAGQIPCFKKN